ncbi:MAG: ABC transporter permease [Actinomycetota bacterium]
MTGIRTALRLVTRAAATVVAATFAVFAALEMSIPGGFRTVILPGGIDESSPQAREIIDRFHLDEPLPLRYGHWVVDVLGGDFGRSTRGGVPVTEVLTHRLSISLQLMLAATLLTVAVGLPLGLWAAANADRRSGKAINAFLGLAQSIPVYLTPVFLVWLFAIRLRWLPAAGWVRISDSVPLNLRNLLLPMVALAFAEIGIVGRIVRADTLRVLGTDYVAAAVGKGLTRSYVLRRHALRPASLGLLNVVGLNIGSLLSGAVIIEIIFGIGGLGQVLLEASINRDLYLLLGLTVYTVVIYVGLNAVVDGLMFAVDPRIRRRTDPW